MALKLPNDKIVYNLPEQVGVNAENIGYLAEVYKNIDELPTEWAAWKEATDDVMDGYSDTMGDYALTMGGYQTTMQGYANTMGGYQTTMEGYAAQVDTWTNNIAVAAATAITGQDITPNKVAQTAANYVYDVSTGSIPGGLSYDAGFIRYEVINGVMYIIINFKLTNNSGSDINKAADARILVQTANVGANAANIIDFEGNKCSTAPTYPVLVSYFEGYLSTTDTDPSNIDIPYSKRVKCAIFNQPTANVIKIAINSESSLTIPDESSIYISARTMITLI